MSKDRSESPQSIKKTLSSFQLFKKPVKLENVAISSIKGRGGLSTCLSEIIVACWTHVSTTGIRYFLPNANRRLGALRVSE